MLSKYLSRLRIYLPIIVRFGAELGYKSLCNTFIHLKNLASALEDKKIIDKKLSKYLKNRGIKEVIAPTLPFISSSLCFVTKRNKN